MSGYWRAGMAVVALLIGRTAMADDSAVPAAQVVAAKVSSPRFAFDVASRGVCFGIGELGCAGGEQFGFVMKYGEVHVGVMFGAAGFRDTYLVVSPFVGGEVGTRYYSLARRRRFEFAMAGRATLDLFLSVPPNGPDNKVLVFLNTIGPSLRLMFGERFGAYFRAGIGYDVGGTVNSTDSRAEVSLAGDAQLGMMVRF